MLSMWIAGTTMGHTTENTSLFSNISIFSAHATTRNRRFQMYPLGKAVSKKLRCRRTHQSAFWNVSGRWEENWEPRENPHEHGKNMRKSVTRAQDWTEDLRAVRQQRYPQHLPSHQSNWWKWKWFKPVHWCKYLQFGCRVQKLLAESWKSKRDCINI